MQEIKTTINALRDFINSKEFERVLIVAIQEGINSRRYKNKDKARIEHLEGRFKNLLSKYGFDPDEILDVWNGSYTKHSPQPQIERNMNMVLNLEEKRPGIASLLYKKFGIRNFERYPEEILIAQFDEYDSFDKPYGIMMQATHDWNGALGDWHNTEVWKKLYGQMKDKFSFRIVEAKNKIELARRLIWLDRKHGNENKISFAFIGGHGSRDTISFSEDGQHDRLFSEDLAGEGIKRAGKFFKHHPVFVLISCSTGIEGGIGEKLSKKLNAKVIAPNTTINIKDIDAIISDDKIDFDVQYESKNGAQDVAKIYLPS